MEADVLTRPAGSFGKDDAKPGMAFFEGTGPQEKCCGDCVFRGYSRQSQNGTWNETARAVVYRSYRVQSCRRFKQLAGCDGPKVDRNWRSCKYFEQKPKD